MSVRVLVDKTRAQWSTPLPPSDTIPFVPSDAAFDEQVLWQCLHAKRHVMLSGRAGAGKTHLLKRFKDRCTALSGPNVPRVEFAATTGIAAINIDAKTLDNVVGFLGETVGAAKRWELIRKHRRHSPIVRAQYETLKRTGVLLIEEVSMLDKHKFEKLDRLFRLARATPDTPFGGVLLILSGDFTQLPPPKGEFMFHSPTWRALPRVRVFLDRCYRQDDTSVWMQILNAVRSGTLSADHRALLVERQIPRPEENEGMVVYGTNKLADKYNLSKLELTASPDARIHSKRGSVHVIDTKTLRPVRGNTERFLTTDMRRTRVLKFCIGARVMMTCNQYLTSHRVSNGSLGVVRDIENNHVRVAFDNGATVAVKRCKTEVLAQKRYTVRYTQFPLRLAWALTVHKVQGLTLDRICVDVGSLWEKGQLYVALSRVRRLQDLHVLRFTPAALRCDADAVRFERV